MNYLPPTDNLYKFCAIAGLIIVGFSVYYPFHLISTLYADMIDVSTDLDVLDAEEDFRATRLTKLRALTKNTIERQQGHYKPDPGKLEIAYSNQELKSLEDEMDRLELDLRTGIAKAKGKHQKTQSLLVQLAIISLVAIVSCGAGLRITAYGFRSWHRLVQKPLDEKLKAAGSKEDTQPDVAGTTDRPS